MNSPESGEPQFEQEPTDPREKIDQVLDRYGELLREIEKTGPSVRSLAERKLLEDKLTQLRSEMPTPSPEELAFQETVDTVLDEAYEQGRLTRVKEAVAGVIQEDRSQALLEHADEVKKRGPFYHALSPEEANEVVLHEINAKTEPPEPTEEDLASAAILEPHPVDLETPAQESSVPEVQPETETDPTALARTITGLDKEIRALIVDMGQDVLGNIKNYHRATEEMSADQREYTKAVARRRGSYLNWEETLHEEFPGSDVTVPETLTDIPVEKLRDIASAIRLNIRQLLELRQGYRHNHPELG